ncbi:hypothetical protein LIER_21191 [Lithospermum erythrorhizon]|uniref:Uncharacterized protein n=1 Tax=Lithospermum erythrorhizon TaxID=34254 RepID=A0AAV3QRU8_LITER
MYEPQNFLDLQDDPNAAGADPKSWLSGDGDNFSAASPPPPPPPLPPGNVDQRLLRDLVDMVPLVQSLIEQKQRSSFTRRGSMTYTKAPSKESLYRKEGRNAAQSVPRKNNADGFSRSSLTEKDREELMALREQVEDLQKKLSEKDELLKSVEISKSEVASVLAEVNELKEEAASRESLLKSTQLQFSDTKIKLADKQAAVERLEWEAMTSKKKVEKLQQDMDRVQSEITTMMLVFEGLQMKESSVPTQKYDDAPYGCDLLNEIDDYDESKMQMLEEAREAYATAVAAAREKQDEESLAVAATARSHLQSLVVEKNLSTCNGGSGLGATCY